MNEIPDWLRPLIFIVCGFGTILCGIMFLFLVTTLGDGDVWLKLLFAPLMLVGVLVNWKMAYDSMDYSK